VKHIAIFASGAGSNAQKIIEHFNLDDKDSLAMEMEMPSHQKIIVSLIVCNNPSAGVLIIAAKEAIPVLMIEKEKFFQDDAYLIKLRENKIDFIVLAGFLWKIPDPLIDAYPNRIINIHPALLPRYGGKGMYGHKVHQAVIANGDIESGITIHYVDGQYDNGDIIFQAKCPVLPGDSANSLAERVHQLEHEHYSRVIGEVVEQLIS
jgi:phosphoribosylglycinamide formyltransferase 1